jgi:hypothetical protein
MSDTRALERLFNARHEDYLRAHDAWETMYLAWQGGRAFKRAFLWRYEREEHEDWLERLRRASCENLLRDIITRRESLVFSRRVTRIAEGAAADYAERINCDIDGRGTPRDRFVRACFRLSQVFGFLPVLIDRRGDDGAGDDARGGLPYAAPLLPFDLLNWSRAADGSLDWALVRHRLRRDSDPFAPAAGVTEYRLLTRDSIRAWREVADERALAQGRPVCAQIEEIGSVEHELGCVPLVLLYDQESEDGSLPGRASLFDPCELSIKLFNQTSWYDQLLYKTNYATLAANPFNGSSEEPEVVVGAGDVFWVPEGGQMPHWISPDVGPAEVFERKLKDMRRRIYEQAELDAGSADESRDTLSGEAYDRRRRPTEDMARRLGRNLEAFERELDRMMIGRWLGLADFEPRIEYPRRYGVRAVSDAVAELRAVEQATSLPPRVKALLAGTIVFTGGFSELDDATQEELEKEIRAWQPPAPAVTAT